MAAVPASENDVDPSVPSRAEIERYLDGDAIEPAGRFIVEHAGLIPYFRGDRSGFIRAGVAMIRYAIEARPEPNSDEVLARSLRNLFSPASRAQGLVLILDEQAVPENAATPWHRPLTVAVRSLFSRWKRKGQVPLRPPQ